MKRRSISTVLLLTIIGFFFAGIKGCMHYQGEGAVPTIIATSEAFKAFDGEYENTVYFKDHKPESIAVLPFSSLEEKPFRLADQFDRPEEIVRKGMYNHISSLPFNDLELFAIDNRLKNAGLIKSENIQQLIIENPSKLKSLLGVDAVVTGEVTHFDRIYVGIYSQVAVGCEVKLWDLSSGNLLWRAKHVSRAHAGGISLNPIGLLMSAAASVWNLRDTEMLSQTDEVFREIVSTIELPQSALTIQAAIPVIDLFAVLNSEKPYTAGQEIVFRMMGDPGCKAYVDLGDYKHAIRLEPLTPQLKAAVQSDLKTSTQRKFSESGQGLTDDLVTQIETDLATREIYQGGYTVVPQEEAYGLIAKAYLVNPRGDQGSRIDVVHIVDIDGKPPAAPLDVLSESLDQKIKLHWVPSPEGDLKGYEIWKSDSPLSGYAFLKTSERHEAILSDLANFLPIYIKINAFDKADNKSPFSQYIQAIPLPEPNLYDLKVPGQILESELGENMLLTAEKSPYFAHSDVRVNPGVTLYAEPGVEIRFSANTSLHVAGGGFIAYGQKNKMVRLVPSRIEAASGSWNGLILDHAARTQLNHVAIEKAVTGITVTNSAPVVFATTIQRCSQAGIHLREYAAPIISCSVMTANEGQGALVIEGEGVAPIIRNNLFQDNEPFHVQSYTPLQIDLSGNYWGSQRPEADRFLGDVVWHPALMEPPQTCRFD